MKYKIWLYGKPFSGKTYFATSGGKTVVISTDGNAQFYDCDIIRVKTIEEFSKAVDQVKKDGNKYDTIVVDVLEHIFDMQREYMLDKFELTHESDDTKGFGKIYNYIRKGFWTIIRELSEFDDHHVIIISHEDEYEETSRLGVVTTKFRPRLDDTKEGLHDKISGIMHFVMRAYVSVDKQNVKTYKISCGSTADELSGNRLPLKNKLFGNTWKEFLEEIENVKKV